MTQTVFDNRMVAHVWAQRSQEEGRSHNGNFSFRGDILYSYSTPIGRFVETPMGHRVVLVNSRRYSVTTSGKHMPALWDALRGEGYRVVYQVPNIMPVGKGEHEANRDHLLCEYREAASRVRRMRDYYGTEQTLAETLRAEAAAVTDYEEMFGLPVTSLNPEETARETMEARAQREAKANTPEALVRREKARAQREARAERREQLERAEAAERVEAWRRGEPVALRWGEGRDEAGGALLRVRGNTLETSLGAKVPLADAVRVFKFVKLCRKSPEQMAWKRNGAILPVGHFQVDYVTNTGTFRAGCHLIHWDEIVRAAEAAGVLFEDAADTTVKEAA